MSRVKYIGGRSGYFRKMPEPARPCACGQENKQPRMVVGRKCWAAAPANLRKEVYSRDLDVAREAVRSLLDFARGRNIGQNLQNKQNSGPEKLVPHSFNSVSPSEP
jgi:hypothetical protein